MSEWQDIETAPKDGTEILAWIPSWYQGKGGRCFAVWFEEKWMPSDKHMREIHPSHWMIGPEGPK